MRNPLYKRFPRELRSNIGKYLGLFFMMLIAVAFTGGYLLAANSMEVILNGMEEKYQIEDGRFVCDFEADDEAIDAVEKLGATVYPDFYRQVPLDLGASGDGAAHIQARLYANRTTINLVAYAEGRAPQSATEVALDRLFMENHGLHVGDTVSLEGKPFEIVGVCTLPDYQALFENNTDFVHNALVFTVGQLTPDGLAALSPASDTYAYSFVFDDESLDLAQRTDIEEEMIDALVDNGCAVSDFIDAEDNQGIGFAIEDITADRTVFTVMLFILIAIMAFVFSVLTGATIESESNVIGTLLASGWRKSELLRHYLVMPAFVGVISVVLGLVVGTTLLSDPLKNLYYNSYSIPPYELHWDASIIFFTVVLPFVLLMLITVMGLMRKLRFTPLQFLRRETTSRKRSASLPLPDGLRYASRFRLRVLLRNASHFATLFFGIAFASLLLLFGTCLLPVIQNYAIEMRKTVTAPYQYVLKAPLELDGSAEERERYAAALRLVEDHDRVEANQDAIDAAERLDDNEELMDAFERAEKFAMANVEIQRAMTDKFETVAVYGIQPNSRYWTDIPVKDGVVYAGLGAVEKTVAQVGESVEAFNRREGESYLIDVADTTDNEADVSLYMTLDDFNRLFGNDADYFNAYASGLQLELDGRYLARTIVPEDMDKISAQMEDSMGSFATMMLFMAVPIYLVLVYLLTKTVIDRSARSISYMKVFGYRNREVNGLYVRPITYWTLLSLVASLPLVVGAITGLLKVAFLRFSGNFPLIIPTERLLLIVAVGMATYSVVAFLHVRRIKKVPLELAMKVQE